MDKGEFKLIGKVGQLIAKYSNGYFAELSFTKLIENDIENLKKIIEQDLPMLEKIQENKVMLLYKVICFFFVKATMGVP